MKHHSVDQAQDLLSELGAEGGREEVGAFRKLVALIEKAALADELAEALRAIEQWNSFPSTGRCHEDGTPKSYAYCFGSNGERDYMRSVARAALAKHAEASKP